MSTSEESRLHRVCTRAGTPRSPHGPRSGVLPPLGDAAGETEVTNPPKVSKRLAPSSNRNAWRVGSAQSARALEVRRFVSRHETSYDFLKKAHVP